MQLIESYPEVQKSGNFKEEAFKLKAGPKLFRLMSDSLYSRKIEAVVRELSTNAYDAHIASNNPNPFEVHLPNWSEPFFKIRDYGTGLSEKDIFEIYTTYGESTKDNSDDFVGCLGLGSKSPFCVPGNDSFNVTSYFNGVKYEYTAYINEDGIPQIALVNSSRTKEQNGLEVSFSVETGDIAKFVQVAPIIYKWFPVKPIITGQNITIPSIVYTGVEGSIVINNKNVKWTVTKENTSFVIMGNVAYPLNINWTSKYSTLLYGRQFCIYVPIGMCNFTVSRESLEYNKPTIANIEAILDEILLVYTAELQNKLNSCSSYWEACIYYINEYYSFNGLLQNPTYKNKKIEYNISVDLKKLNEEITYCYGRKLYSESQHYSFTPKDSSFIIRDDSVAIQKKTKKLQQKRGGTVYIISQKLADYLQTEYEAPDDIFFLQADCDYDKVSGTRGGVRTTKILKWVGNYHTNGSNSWEDANVKDTDKIYYVEVNRYNVKYNKEIKYGDFRYLINEAQTLGFTKEIYGIKTSIINRAKKNKNWVNFFEYIKPILQKYVDNNIDLINCKRYYSTIPWIEKLNPSHTKFIKLKKEYNRIAAFKQKNCIIPFHMMSLLQIECPKLPIWNELEEFLEKYPILGEVYSYGECGFKHNLEEYFQLLERYQK